MNRKTLPFISLICLLLFVTLPWNVPTGIAASSKIIPSSKRSVEVIKKVKPKLEKELAKKGLSYGSPIFIRVFKDSSELELWIRQKTTYRKLKTYSICFYSGDLGPKTRQGDYQSPEGFYYVAPHMLRPQGSYHVSFFINYPNTYDRTHHRTGGLIMIHGKCVSAGCYAMTDERVEEIYALADAAFRGGQTFFRVHIFPFRMTKKNMARHADSKWNEFWENLKQGYDYFETRKIPPNVVVKNEKYAFEDDVP